jgi:3-oxoadipate enol-lactonase
MPTATINGTEYAYTDEGEGPLLLFGHGLLASKAMFDAQIEELSDRWRCVSVDWPGHGDSGHRPGGWSFYDMVDDTVALVSELGHDKAVFAGLSQGGMVFMRLAMEHPELVHALILLDTSAGPENAESLPAYEQLREGLLKGDDAQRDQMADAVTNILYGPTWHERDPDGVVHEKALMLSHDRDGINLACRAVFDRDDVTARLDEITAPTLVICGEDDAATTPDNSELLAERIAGAELVMIPESGHHSPIENPAAVTEAMETFLARVGPPA